MFVCSRKQVKQLGEAKSSCFQSKVENGFPILERCTCHGDERSGLDVETGFQADAVRDALLRGVRSLRSSRFRKKIDYKVFLVRK